jgi:CubicO group peptidase (beta-lactamase class C family)
MTRRVVLGLFLLVVALPALAQGLPQGTPESAGLSSERLRRLTGALQRLIDDRRMAGSVTLIARGGKVVHFEALGLADVEAGVPMRRDTIVRIASFSKAVTSVAAMLLVEEGRLQLTDPVSKYLPAFAKTTVMEEPAPGAPPSSAPRTVPAKRAITIRDLLTHTSGIPYGGSEQVEAPYAAAGLSHWYLGDSHVPMEALVERLAGLPFLAQPGEKFVYGLGTDVLGVVVEKVSGQTLDAFFRDRIFEPLGMHDTFFFLPPEKRGRLATLYEIGEDGKLQRAAPGAGNAQAAFVDGPRKCFSGGAGLLSTAGDYARFLSMLLGGGQLDGTRLLSPKTVQLMTANHVGTKFAEGQRGFGLGFGINEDIGRSGYFGTAGQFVWGSGFQGVYLVDPAEQLIAIYLAQLFPAGDADFRPRFSALVYQAVVGPPEPSGKTLPAPRR